MTTTFTAIALIAAVTMGSAALAKQPRDTGRGTGPVVYVTSQDLFYDSIVLTDLSANGPFQQLFPGEGLSGLATEHGPGDTEYLGGRWWVDANENEVMEGGTPTFFAHCWDRDARKFSLPGTPPSHLLLARG